MQLDTANRVSFMRRGPASNPQMMTATYAYLANGQVSSVTYANNAQTVSDYDIANRVTTITHKLPTGTVTDPGPSLTADGFDHRRVETTILPVPKAVLLLSP